jgi:hypothetical protein
MRLLAIACMVLAAFTFTVTATADDRPNVSPESRVLEKYVGTWDEEMTNKPTEWVPKAEKSTAVTKRTWVLGGNFVRGEGKWRPANTEYLHLLTYDPVANKYRSWYFDASGEMPRGQVTGAWDEKAGTMTWRGTDEAGNRTMGTHQFIDKDRQAWTLVVRDPNGKVVLDLAGKCTRRNE